MSLAAAAILTPRTAQAEADTFGTGNGHNGAYAAVAADEVINTYAPITADVAAGATSIMFGTPIGNLAAPLGDPNGFIAGDLVMIWRATGVTAAEAPSGSATRIDLAAAGVAGGRVGTFEFARVMTATATSITLTKPVVNAWAKDVTQIVRVPEFTTVDIPAATGLAAVAWQTAGTGFAGGILVFLSSGDVTNAGTLNANAKGFRGGGLDATLSDVNITCTDNDNTEANGYAAKGEGIASTEYGGTTHGGKGNRANGAGGGNCTENGGGGGGGFGAGGTGGTSVVGQARSGIGGVGLDYSLLTRLSLGGGGGAGEQKNGVGSAGGAGGGTIFLRAKAVLGAGVISANGEDAANTGITVLNESDGAGGGGAGGNILIRAVGNVTCGAAQTKGGKGGDTTVIGFGPWGAGGGGGGGRVLIQAKSSASCAVSVIPGPGGQSGVAMQSGAVGVTGQTQPPPAGPFCFSNPATDAQCANPSPVCDPTTGVCQPCTGPFGGGTPRACTVNVMPVCSPNGACSPCDGDLGGSTAFTCQLGTAPFCNLTGSAIGSCGKCTTNADCAGGGHGGTVCNPTIGACGTPCTDDSMCKAGAEWCAQGVCVPKTPNGDHVPTVPPIGGECTPANGKRTCLSNVCEMDDDLCGLHNGSPCDGMDAECRSKICFQGDKLCGKPTGEPCADPGQCRSAECTAGICTGCDDDTDCANGKVCDKPMKTCVPGCRQVNGMSNCVAPKVCSKTDGTIGQCIDGSGADGGINPLNDAGDNANGFIEGGGCACRTSMPISGSPIALVAAAVGALLLARRRRERAAASAASTDNDNQDQG